MLFVRSARASTEPDTVELRASQFLSKEQIHGPHRTIRDRVTNEGCINAYRSSSPFGEFDTTRHHQRILLRMAAWMNYVSPLHIRHRRRDASASP